MKLNCGRRSLIRQGKLDKRSLVSLKLDKVRTALLFGNCTRCLFCRLIVRV